MRSNLLAALVAAVAIAAPAAEQCHCSFDAPSGWEVQQIAPCVFGLRPKEWPRIHGREDDRDFGEYAITIRVTRQRFRDAARQSFFRRDENKPSHWIVVGRQASRDDATWIKSDGWFGLRGTTTVGYFYKRNGTGYAGLDYACRSVLSTGRWRTAIIMADNPFTEAEFDAVVKSFRFDPDQRPENSR